MKVRRKQAILELIKKQAIMTQSEMVSALSSQGFDVTQATISRDIKELGLIKIPLDGGGYRYSLAESQMVSLPKDRLRRLLRDNVLQIINSDNMIVIKTMPGGAQGVASALDSSDIPGIIGTVGGDDTILVIVKPKKMVSKIVNDFRKLADLPEE